MQRNYCNAIFLSAQAAALSCVPILQSNTNDNQRSLPDYTPLQPKRNPVTGLPAVICEPTQDRRFAEVWLVPISPEELKDELRDWANNDFLYSLVPKDLPEPLRREIAQESWRVVRDRPPESFHDRAGLRSYGAKVVRSVTIRFTCGRRRVNPVVALTGSHDFIERQANEAGKFQAAPEEALDQQQCKALLYREIATLPRRQRQILELLKLEGLPAKEVARRQGVTVLTVRDMAKKAARRLMLKFGQLGQDKGPRRDSK